MRDRKKLQELTIKDNFMFGAVMMEEQNCRRFLELALGFPIETIEISKEKSLVYHPEYKGIRLDVFAKDSQNTHYNVEMQVIKKENLSRRSRYYHSQIDMELLLSGTEYGKLPDAYVIFICDFDPFGKKKYCYTFKNVCMEDGELLLDEGTCTVFFNTKGRNDSEVSEALIKFLRFVGSDLEDSASDYKDDFVKQLQESVQKIKSSREMGERYMLFEEMLQEERKEGREEGIKETLLEWLEDLGPVSSELRTRIEQENDLNILKKYCRKAAQMDSLEQFCKEIF